MINSSRYLIVKEKAKKTITYFEYSQIKGFNMTSKNKNLKLKDAINVNKMVIINQSFIEKIVDKKVNNKLKKLINLICNIYESDDDPAGSLMLSLNEVEKFKREMINRYIEYMTKEQLKSLNNKLKLLEKDVTIRAYVLNEKQMEMENENTKAR